MDHAIKLLATICARGGSKGVPGKNIRNLLGKPLIAHTIELALASKLFEHVVVSTDSEEIAEIARSYGAEVPFLRPKELANDTCPKWPAVRYTLLEYEKISGDVYDVIVDLDPTSPLRNIDDIKNCITLLNEKEAPNVITAMPARRSPYFNLIEEYPDGRIGLAKTTETPITCRQDSPKCYDMNASIYVWSRNAILNNDSVFLDKTALYVMPDERSIDIDCELDFQFVEFLATKKTEQH
jgi:CMP-N,N'-diacetyllegionaminic acid synthase